MVVGAGLAVATTTGAASTVVVGAVVVGAVVVVVVGAVVVGTVVVGVVVTVVGVVVVGVVVTVLMGFFEKFKTVTFFPPAKNDVFLKVLVPDVLAVPVLLVVNVLVELVLINLAELPLVLNKLVPEVGAVLVVLNLKNLEKNAPTF